MKVVSFGGLLLIFVGFFVGDLFFVFLPQKKLREIRWIMAGALKSNFSICIKRRELNQISKMYIYNYIYCIKKVPNVTQFQNFEYQQKEGSIKQKSIML